MPICKTQDKTVYHPRNPKASPLWQCVDAHFEDFVHAYQAHAVVADGLFTPSGSFYVMPSVEIKPLEELFRARLIRLLVKERLLAQEMAEDLMNWRHSGFSVYNGEPITN